MASVRGVHSVCDSIVQFLRNAYPLQEDFPFQFRVVSSGELNGQGFDETLALYLYRVTVNEHVRSQPLPGRDAGDSPPLSIDLHFMLSLWSKSAAAEQTVCAWVMQQLHHYPLLDQSSLTAEGGWRSDDVVQIIPAELSNEDLMRIWDALAVDYRLSLSYIARVVRIDPPEEEESVPVVATRFHYVERKP